VIIACSGLFGSGKSAYASWLAARIHARRGCPVWANYTLVGSRALRSIPQLYECIGGVIVLDELQGTIHARRSSKNLEFLEWFDQCRKQDSDVLVITQALHKIDVIVREMIEVCYHCQRVDGRWSEVVGYDLTGATPVIRNRFGFDRSLAYGLYNHRERAWRLLTAEEVEKAVEPQISVLRGSGAASARVRPRAR
jgi:hypothetical protein